jgi:TRAP-type C4-dicarboxylate transport system substrate-binding protein
MINRRHFAALALCAAATSTASAQTTILFNSFIPATHPVNTLVFKPWADEVAKVTQGRVKIDIPTSSLAAPPQQMDGVIKGVFDMAYQYHGFLENKVKLSQLAHLTGVNTTAKGSSIALWRTYEKFFKPANEYKDVHVVGFFVLPPGTIFGMKGPIERVADIKGVKFYTTPGLAADLFSAAGAGVVSVPATRSHEIISGGTVDAFAGYSVTEAGSFKTLQYAKQITDVPGGINAPSFAIFLNKKKWASVSPADREAIGKISGEALAERMAAVDKVDAKFRADAEALGIKIRPASASFTDELHKLAEPQVQAWMKDAKSLGVDGSAALTYYKAQAQANR